MSRIYAVKAYYDADRGQLIVWPDDVLGIVRQVRELYGDKVTINLDPLTGWFHFVEHTEDGTERLIFSVDKLDQRALRRLQAADSQWPGHIDPYDALERAQDEEQAITDARYREKVSEVGERLAFALKRDGLVSRLPLSVPIGGRHAELTRPELPE